MFMCASGLAQLKGNLVLIFFFGHCLEKNTVIDLKVPTVFGIALMLFVINN